ncbi:MAG: cupin domain-containing protein [Proteobacteria bacterium]|nr:cupin domain-containing protein [Pseudomonadota bacterium]
MLQPNSIHHFKETPFLVSRDDIPSLYSVDINHKSYFLGILKDFRKHSRLSKFLPEQGRISLSWVHLGENEVLMPHTHPIDSMIIVCSGKVKSLGEVETILQEGDIFFTPAHSLHGFIGLENKGFWGLSLQFEERGLYENSTQPLVSFIKDVKEPAINDQINSTSLSSILKLNKALKEDFSHNKLFAFLNNPKNQTEEIKENFLSFFQIWSNAFQKMVLLRSVFCSQEIYQKIANIHMEEEFGHNISLQKERKTHKTSWDPILCATAEWFPGKIMSLDEVEKIALVHLVIEASATIFYQNMPFFISGASNDSSHFKIHQDIDENHELLGLSLLENLDAQIYKNISTLQTEGWAMLNKMFERISELLQTKIL